MSSEAATIAEWLADASSAVAFTGAGISTESGIPDFRSPGGVWANNRTVYFDEFMSSADDRFEYWRQKAESHADMHGANPNTAHAALARWESIGRLRGVITQNIDGLHQKAGNQHVLELHGTACYVACLKCAWRDEADRWVRRFREEQQVPDCPDCGGFVKHATVSFGQSLSADVLYQSSQWSREADVYLAMGSSLVVEPAASLPVTAKQNGARLIIINRDPTPLDSIADLVVNSALGETMARIDELLD